MSKWTIRVAEGESNPEAMRRVVRLLLEIALDMVRKETALITVKDAAQELKISKTTIYKAIKAGKLKCQTYGKRGQIKIHKSDLAAFCSERATKSE